MKGFPAIVFALVLAWIVVPLTACPGSNPSNPTTPAQLAPGYQNAADQQMGEILSGARSFYVSIQQQATPVCPDGQPVGCSKPQPTLVLDPTVKASFNQFGIALNAAETVYLAYHNGTATQAQAQAAVNTVQSKQAALPLPGAK